MHPWCYLIKDKGKNTPKLTKTFRVMTLTVGVTDDTISCYQNQVERTQIPTYEQ